MVNVRNDRNAALWQLLGISSRVVVHVQRVAHERVERMARLRAIERKRETRELLEVKYAGISPPPCISSLPVEEFLLEMVTLTVYIRCHFLPDASECLCLTDTLVVGVTESIPQRLTRMHAVCPRDVMEPKEQPLRAFFKRVVDTV